jgi:TetR/AcrR family transcriptional repressor of mexJK operon
VGAETARRGRPTQGEAGLLQGRLLECALEVFLANGYAAATIDAIVTAARVSKRTVYSRFSSKAALFEAAVGRHLANQFAPIEQQDHRHGDIAPRERLIAIGERFLRAAQDAESRAVDRIVMAEARNFPNLVKSLHAAGKARADALVQILMVEAGVSDPSLASQAFYALLVIAPMRDRNVDDASQGPDVAAVVDFLLASRPDIGAPAPPNGQ